MWDVKECKMLAYILHQHNQFHLACWEFYNRFESDKYGLVVCEGFVSIHAIVVDFLPFF